jgi:hypothetical protein
MTSLCVHSVGRVKPPRRATVRGRGHHRVIGSSMAKRIGTFGRDYPASWCQVSLFVGDDGIETEDICCAYCGDRYRDAEHIVPWSWLSKVSPLSSTEFWTWIVPACHECNLLASDQVFRSPAAKRRYIQERLKGRYARELSGEPWDDGEIEELGYRLGQFVKAKQAETENLRLRISYKGPLPVALGSHSLNALFAGDAGKGKSAESANCKASGAS